MNQAEPSSRHKEIGPYQLGLLLGEGGMGKVYKAFDGRLGRWVAVKRLRGDATPRARERLRREARILAQLGHPGIVQVFDVVADEEDDWIVMELVDGPTLAELRRGGPLDVGLALDYGRQIASALAAAHQNGIVHRDLKTENVMVLPSGHVKVLDFGLARRVAPTLRDASGSDGTTMTADSVLSRAGAVVGTPRAMSPEQVTGRDVDARSDLFSLGVLLYEILTARSPFVAPSVEETLRRILTHCPPPVRRLNPKVPRALSELVDRLLEKESARRPQTAAAVAGELVAITAGDPLLLAASRGLSRGEPDLEATRQGPGQDGRTRDEGVDEGPAERPPRPATLRAWPTPALPEQPYPVLLPYTHPDFLAGREPEIARLRRLLERPIPILGLSAPSGTGKSSLLLGGLVPLLRAEGVPVALVRHPAEAGVASQLVGDLLDGAPIVADGDAAGFALRLAEVERLAGRAPVLVLDQFEDVLREDATRARCVLGTLMAASVTGRSGLGAPRCRWLVAYRQEAYGPLSLWLGDVLAEARAASVAGVEAWPYDLSGPERFHGMTLPPLARPSSGAADPLAAASEVFLAAIEKPLRSPGGEGSGGRAARPFPWHFPPGHAERLARAFAEARLARPDDPLAPELQVVLAHLLAEAGEDGRLDVPDDPGPLIAKALDDHLRRALEAAFPADGAATATRRARALLALRELATATGQREEGRRPGELAKAIGEGGAAILEKLATPLTRLVVVRQAPDGPRWVLAHDRMAEAVVRLVEEEGRQGQLVVDSELLALRRFVTLRTALHQAGEERASTRVPHRLFRRIAENAEALLWDAGRRAWWTACRGRRRGDRRRLGALMTAAALALVLVGWGAWTWARRVAEHRALLAQVARGEPEAAFRALDRLATRPDADPAELLALLERRDVPMDVLELGLGGLDGPQRSAAVLRAAAIALPWVEERPDDPVLLANLVWALDVAPGRDPPFAERARALRERVLTPLRRLRPPPPFPGPEDPEWIQVPAGTFVPGAGGDEEGRAEAEPRREVRVSAFRMQRHEVTNAELRRLASDQDPGSRDDLPVMYLTWYEAYTYAAWLGGRLPTAVEWEYAARAGCPYEYCAHDGRETTVDAVAWTSRNAVDAATGERGPRPVMQLEPNPWGLYDMLGNVWEATADWYGEHPDRPQRDRSARRSSSAGVWRVVRGGSFGIEDEGSRVLPTSQGGWPPGMESFGMGFRPVIPDGLPEP